MSEVVLGIDPGSRATGFGIVRRDGHRLRPVAQGVVRPSASSPLPMRLMAIFQGISRKIEEFSPDAVAVEEIFFSMNARSALVLGHARGAALLAAANHGLPVHEYSPSEVKNAVVGYGRAEKQQVQQMVRLILGLAQPPPQDAADALAVAICHCNSALFSTRCRA